MHSFQRSKSVREGHACFVEYTLTHQLIRLQIRRQERYQTGLSDHNVRFCGIYTASMGDKYDLNLFPFIDTLALIVFVSKWRM